MRRWFVLFFLTSFAVSQVPQTPRQALLEMIKATSPEQIDKHTPDVLLQAMAKLPPEQRQKQHQSMMFLSLLMTMSPDSVRTFDTGPVFAVIQVPAQKEGSGKKVEITVERDDLSGDTDVMEFGFRIYKDGKVDELPIDPRILIDMKLEKNVWKLARIGGSASIQLDDPKVADLILKSIQEQMKTAAANAQLGATGNAPRTTSESKLVGSLRTLNTAETKYAATYSAFTCRLSDLGGSLSGKAADKQGAQLINPALESGVRYGYRIELSGCVGKQAYKILATPTQKGMNHRTYCTDATGVVRNVEEAQSAQCFEQGKPLN